MFTAGSPPGSFCLRGVTTGDARCPLRVPPAAQQCRRPRARSAARYVHSRCSAPTSPRSVPVPLCYRSPVSPPHVPGALAPPRGGPCTSGGGAADCACGVAARCARACAPARSAAAGAARAGFVRAALSGPGPAVSAWGGPEAPSVSHPSMMREAWVRLFPSPCS